MRGDLKLVRRRTWVSWTLVVVPLGFVVFMCWLQYQGLGDPNGLTLRGVIGALLVVLPIVLVSYAPWTFFNVGRVLSFLVFVGCLYYLVDELRRGRWVTDAHHNQSVPNAAMALLMFGVPGLLGSLLRRPRVSPYDEFGRPRSFEVDRTFRVGSRKEPRSLTGEDGKKTWTEVKFDYAGSSKLVVIDPRSPPLLRVTLPMDDSGLAVWADWQRRLAEHGLYCEVVEDNPGQRSFRESVAQSLVGRQWFGRRVRVEPGQFDS